MIPPDQRRIQTGFDYSRLVAYELGDQAVEAVIRQFERGLGCGHPAAGVILEILRSEPGRTMTFAPPGVPLSRLDRFEDGYALDLDPFDPYGWSTIWAQHIVDRLTGSANPYVVSLDLNVRGRSDGFWTHESNWEATRRFRSTLLWVGDLEMQAAQGAAALDVPTVHEMLGITNQLWAMNVIAGDSPIPLPLIPTSKRLTQRWCVPSPATARSWWCSPTNATTDSSSGNGRPVATGFHVSRSPSRTLAEAPAMQSEWCT